MQEKSKCWLYLLIITSGIGFTNCKKDHEPSNITVTDIDGNVYHTITIGTQVWMVENLNTTRYNDGEAIPHIADASGWKDIFTTSAAAYCNYDNTESNASIYGRLYNWYAISTGKLAPKGWHVPTNAEWSTLANYLVANGYNYDGTTTGNKFAKAFASATGWDVFTWPGTVGNTDYPAKRNASGFTALPGGCREPNNGAFIELRSGGFFWSSSGYDGLTAHSRHLGYTTYGVYEHIIWKKEGFSVRCVRD